MEYLQCVPIIILFIFLLNIIINILIASHTIPPVKFDFHTITNYLIIILPFIKSFVNSNIKAPQNIWLPIGTHLSQHIPAKTPRYTSV